MVADCDIKTLKIKLPLTCAPYDAHVDGIRKIRVTRCGSDVVIVMAVSHVHFGSQVGRNAQSVQIASQV